MAVIKFPPDVDRSLVWDLVYEAIERERRDPFHSSADLASAAMDAIFGKRGNG